MISALRGSRASQGFSLVELLVALAIALLVTSAVFAMLEPASGAFQTQPERADVEQRTRATADALVRDLLEAGSAPVTVQGTAGAFAAAVFPLRIGRRSPDPPGTFNSSRISVWSASAAAPQAVVTSALASATGAATIAPGAGCADGDPTCGFRTGTNVVVLARSGALDAFTITAVNGSVLSLQHNLRDSAVVYPAGTALIAEATIRTYFFRDDRLLGYAQLLRYDDGGGGDVPVVDHIASLALEYFGDPDPPAVVAGSIARTTYGPLPPPVGVALTAYPPGENCAFARGTGGEAVPRLARLGSALSLAPLPPSSLTDGPWCPDSASPNRYDADLLRVRQIVATFKIESAVAALRGPAGVLFTRAGTATGTRLVPDRQTRVVVAPRALNAGR